MSKGFRAGKVIGEIKRIPDRPTYSEKDIDILIRYHRTLREGLFEEIMEDCLGERTLTTRLERYGQNSKFWKKSESFKYENSSTKSKRPSEAWLHTKVKCYESETLK